MWKLFWCCILSIVEDRDALLFMCGKYLEDLVPNLSLPLCVLKHLIVEVMTFITSHIDDDWEHYSITALYCVPTGCLINHIVFYVMSQYVIFIVSRKILYDISRRLDLDWPLTFSISYMSSIIRNHPCHPCQPRTNLGHSLAQRSWLGWLFDLLRSVLPHFDPYISCQTWLIDPRHVPPFYFSITFNKIPSKEKDRIITLDW